MKRKNDHLNIRISREEHREIRRRAQEAGMNASAFIRKRALSDDNRPVIRADARVLQTIYRDLRHAGGNLNQCARELNTHHRPNQIEEELSHAFKAVEQATELVAEFIADIRENN